MFFTSENDTNYDTQFICDKIEKECCTLIITPKKKITIPTLQKKIEYTPSPKIKKNSYTLQIKCKNLKFSIS
jgi:hypothetical protein